MKKIVVLLLWLCVSIHAQFDDASIYADDVTLEGEEGAVVSLYDFSFVGTDYKSAFQAISVAAKIDILPDPDVTGSLTIKVKDKTWQDVLKIICALHDLTWVISDNYIRIMRTSTYQRKEKERREQQEEIDNLAPLIRRTFAIKHAKAADLLPALRSLVSARGRIGIIERNNAIMVYDTEDRLLEVLKTLKELDVETRQIMITAKMIVVDSRLYRELGVDWATRMGQGNTGLTNDGAAPVRGATDSRSRMAMNSTPQGINALNTMNTATSVSMGLLDGNLGVTINQMMLDERTEILATPQITTLDHEEAEIFMGERVSLRVIDAEGQAGYQEQEAGIKLVVTPHITGDNKILMELRPENTTFKVNAEGQPIFTSQEAHTNVVVADGETAIIAGLTQNEEQTIESGIPFLKDIPFLGYLFKHERKEMVKKDLIILVTPHVSN
ncbi:MAG: secretin and TonB N-terminal domain-containing protein [Fibrobacterales bacterium]